MPPTESPSLRYRAWARPLITREPLMDRVYIEMYGPIRSAGGGAGVYCISSQADPTRRIPADSAPTMSSRAACSSACPADAPSAATTPRIAVRSALPNGVRAKSAIARSRFYWMILSLTSNAQSAASCFLPRAGATNPSPIAGTKVSATMLPSASSRSNCKTERWSSSAIAARARERSSLSRRSLLLRGHILIAGPGCGPLSTSS